MKTKKLIKAAMFCYSTQTGCKNCPLYLDLDHCPKLYMMLVNRLEELYEKEKAKKAEYQQVVGVDNHIIGNCPTCGQAGHDGMKYCAKCGQKLKWGVTK